MDAIICNQALSGLADTAATRINDGISGGNAKIVLLKSSLGPFSTPPTYSDVASGVATFKGYAPHVLEGAMPTPSGVDGGYEFAICADVEFAYDSEESGDSSDTIGYVAVFSRVGGADTLEMILPLETPYTFSSDGHALTVDLKFRIQNPPYPVP